MIDSIEVHGLREYSLTGKRPRIVLNGIEYDTDRMSFFVGVNCVSLDDKKKSWSKTYIKFGGYNFYPLLLHFLTTIHSNVVENKYARQVFNWAICSFHEITTTNAVVKAYWKWRSARILTNLEKEIEK